MVTDEREEVTFLAWYFAYDIKGKEMCLKSVVLFRNLVQAQPEELLV